MGARLNGQQIYTLEANLTTKEVEAVKNRLTGEAKRTFETLVNLGDSEKLAIASILAPKVDNQLMGINYKAYCL